MNADENVDKNRFKALNAEVLPIKAVQTSKYKCVLFLKNK